LNDELVVNNVTFENSVEKGKLLYPFGSIELQNHHSPLWFKNIYIRELPRTKAHSAKQKPPGEPSGF
jgi:hypothetical protein